jgi:large subunit ribosomal protein L24
MSRRLKKDDIVFVTVGKDKGKQGKIIQLYYNKNMVVVEGINIGKIHTKKSEKSEGGIIEKPRPIHQSNVALVCPEKKVPTKIGYKKIGSDTKKRVSKVSGATF